eukprot:2357204-Pyramimonas_sp.AAC.1
MTDLTTCKRKSCMKDIERKCLVLKSDTNNRPRMAAVAVSAGIYLKQWHSNNYSTERNASIEFSH